MKIYVASYCQNEYQKKRVRDFVESKLGEIVNMDFSERNKNLFLTSVDCNESLMCQAEQVWVILCKNIRFDRQGIKEREQLAKELGKPVRYFRINQTGKYVGRVHETKREEIFDSL